MDGGGQYIGLARGKNGHPTHENSIKLSKNTRFTTSNFGLEIMVVRPSRKGENYVTYEI